MGFLGMVGYASRFIAGVTCGWVTGIVTLKYPYLDNEEEIKYPYYLGKKEKKLEPKEDAENN